MGHERVQFAVHPAIERQHEPAFRSLDEPGRQERTHGVVEQRLRRGRGTLESLGHRHHGVDEPMISASGKVSRGEEVVLLARTHHPLPERITSGLRRSVFEMLQ